MADLKLGKLPDRTPVKLTITITPDLQGALQAYAAIYTATYGVEESVSDLVPAMLAMALFWRKVSYLSYSLCAVLSSDFCAKTVAENRLKVPAIKNLIFIDLFN